MLASGHAHGIINPHTACMGWATCRCAGDTVGQSSPHVIFCFVNAMQRSNTSNCRALHLPTKLLDVKSALVSQRPTQIFAYSLPPTMEDVMLVASRRECLLLMGFLCSPKVCAAGNDDRREEHALTDTPDGPHVRFHEFPDGWYVLTEPIAWQQKDKGAAVVVPAGFVTDLAVVPRITWERLKSDNAFVLAAFVLDWIYARQQVSREQADRTFDDLLKDLKVDAIKRRMLFEAVKWNGARVGRAAQSKQSAGIAEPVA